MNEEELKALVGEKAYEAMTPEQRTAAIGKYTSAGQAALDKVKADKEKADKEKADKEKNKTQDDDGDLNDKVKKEKEAAAAKTDEMKGIEKALSFNMSVEKLLADNSEVLPSEMADLLKAAEKEKYDSAKEKAAAIKTAFIKSFFAIQANVDLLTPSQKTTLDDYLKLTKNGKEDKAAEVYENIFEPTLETLKKVKKAEELGKARAGFSSSSKAEDAYKQKLMAGSRKMYLNEKGA